MLCRPFSPLTHERRAASLPPGPFCFVSPDHVDLASVEALALRFTDLHVERWLHRTVGRQLERLCAHVTKIPNFVRHGRAAPSPRLAILHGVDPHPGWLDWAIVIGERFPECVHLVRRDAREAHDELVHLGARVLPFSTRPAHCPQLSGFSPELLLTRADWTPEFSAVRKLAPEGACTIALQDGPQHWSYASQNRYRNADVFLAEGAVALGEISPLHFSVAGSPEVDGLRDAVVPDPALVLSGTAHVDVERACASLGLAHRRLPPNLGAENLRDEIERASVVVAGFDSLVHHALAAGRHVVYYNPAGHGMPTFTADLGRAVAQARRPEELERRLLTWRDQGPPSADDAIDYLRRHCGPVDGQAANRVAALLRGIHAGRARPSRLARAPVVGPAAPPDRGLRVVFFSHGSPVQYSGGRYHAWMMAEALAHGGHRVEFVSEHLPIFHSDFLAYPSHSHITNHLTMDFERGLPEGSVDLVVVVPGMDRDAALYEAALGYAERKSAHVALLSFETPNWFNALSPEPRDPALWRHWQTVAERASWIIPSAREGEAAALDYYQRRPSECRVAHCHPPINSVVADLTPAARRRPNIVMMTRPDWAEHKGGALLPELIGPALCGHQLVLIAGEGPIPSEQRSALEERAQRYGVGLRLRVRISDREKFGELKRAKLALFPSSFEGFGLPPVEALYCRTPVIAFDLPVLRETCGDALHTVARGDFTAFRRAVHDFVGRRWRAARPSRALLEVASFERYAEEIGALAESVCAAPLPERGLPHRAALATPRTAPVPLGARG